MQEQAVAAPPGFVPDPLAGLPAWAVTFHSFTLQHLLASGVCVLLIVGSCVVGRRWNASRPEYERRLAFAWGGFVIGVNLWSLVYWFLPGAFDVRESLPLQLCDLACLLSPLVFLTRWRWARTLIYFWGIGLSTQAFLTPTLQEGVGHVKFWLFWLVHLAIVGSAIYDVVVGGYRPARRDFLLALLVTVLYGAAMVALNMWLGSNYGYVANTTPERPTVIDKLGPWPGRVFILAGIVSVIFGVLWGVWPVLRAVAARGMAGAQSDSLPRGS